MAKDSLPDILRGLWLNIRVLAVTAVLIVVVGLAIAALRTLRGPIWFPVRALAAAYTDFFRGMPLIILLYLVGFGLPGLQLQGDADLAGRARHDRAGAHLLGVRRRRSSGPASSRCTRASGRRPGRSGLSYGQTMRRVVLPQAVRRVMPPLLNDFVALQKDVGLISVLGALDAVRQAQIHVRRGVQLHAVPRGRAAVRAAGDPDDPGGRRVSVRAARRQQASGSL